MPNHNPRPRVTHLVSIRREALDTVITWRNAGTPGIITPAEAHRLTSGLVGETGDHGTPMSLTSVALMFVVRRRAGLYIAKIGGFRCSVCGCGVRSTHVPGSEDCAEGAREKAISQSDWND